MKNDTPFPFYIKNESTVFAKVLGSIGRCRERKGMRNSFLCLHRSRHLVIFGGLTCLRGGPFKK